MAKRAIKLFHVLFLFCFPTIQSTINYRHTQHLKFPALTSPPSQTYSPFYLAPPPTRVQTPNCSLHIMSLHGAKAAAAAAFTVPFLLTRPCRLPFAQASLRSPRPYLRPSAPRYDNIQRPLMTTTSPTPSPTPTPNAPSFESQLKRPTVSSEITLLYDGECPLCMKEINFLRARQERLKCSKLCFVDISSGDYEASQHGGVDYETAMGSMHAVLRDGTVVTGVGVFRLAYEAVGLGWVYAVTKIPGVGWVADRVYDVWARWRLRLTGRPELGVIMETRRDRVEKGCKRD